MTCVAKELTQTRCWQKVSFSLGKAQNLFLDKPNSQKTIKHSSKDNYKSQKNVFSLANDDSQHPNVPLKILFENGFSNMKKLYL